MVITKAPVLFLTYRRIETAQRVFEAIKKARPQKLYFASNAPNPNISGEAARVGRVRSLLDQVDWDCEIKVRFLEEHLPVRLSVTSSLNWFFSEEEMGIILEDDCLPNQDFFVFCNTLLQRYRDDGRVFVITGCNFQDGQERGNGSYYFSRYSHVWGWASWRRAWKYYDGDLSFWPEWRKSQAWLTMLPDSIERKYWGNIFDRMYANQIDTWDYPWLASIWYQKGFTATPNVNLISNIGFGADSTHTREQNSPWASMATGELGEIRYSAEVAQNFAADRSTFDRHYGGRYLRSPRSLFALPWRIVRVLLFTLKRAFL